VKIPRGPFVGTDQLECFALFCLKFFAILRRRKSFFSPKSDGNSRPTPALRIIEIPCGKATCKRLRLLPSKTSNLPTRRQFTFAPASSELHMQREWKGEEVNMGRNLIKIRIDFRIHVRGSRTFVAVALSLAFLLSCCVGFSHSPTLARVIS
jgi:hypothetical protein